MKQLKSKTTFKDNGQRQIRCPECDRFLTQSYLGEKNVREIKCKCGNIVKIPPPQKTLIDGEKVIKYGPEDMGTYTVDLT